jgi:hypothetical protein
MVEARLIVMWITTQLKEVVDADLNNLGVEV